MFQNLFVTCALLLSTTLSFAQERQARSNDVATKYILENNGLLSRYVNGIKCNITTDVTEYKVSSHKNDLAMIYFVKGGDLYVLNNTLDKSGNCPKAKTLQIVEDVKKYTIVSHTDSKIVNLTLSYKGEFKGWDNDRSVITRRNVKDYLNNTCYKSTGKSFNSYVAFAITNEGEILKVKGDSIESIPTDLYYSSIQEFKNNFNVCK